MNAEQLSNATPSEILDDANFQLLCAAEYLSFSVAIGKAIAADAKNGGVLIDDLTELLTFLKSTQFYLIGDAAQDYGKAQEAVDQRARKARMGSENAGGKSRRSKPTIVGLGDAQ
ncbi:hypothetical protein [Pseudomonas typographi]|uniref:hypothetical protein n=1 Tax=Pseudomonas typographi TaxID=2715964 RepID=UPI0016860EF4|nr:hypothetical protein [Pseudomonas typographi]MBD1553598.1 hypothetical protein [Pseudomonas typographi]MBD1589637.1 hypothetical protein [Pseudomonas typographi]